MLAKSDRIAFQKLVWEHYRQHGRTLPWRQPEADGSFDPYKILVSELMLQQTQVSRVIPKYNEFLSQFPNIAELASSPLSKVLVAWSGLGYNRRAKYLHTTACTIVSQYSGAVPNDVKALVTLPGIGENTAAAITVYSFNRAEIFIETNIRTVYIHHFFPKEATVTDKEIAHLVEQTLSSNNPREWYWALMDYGASLKAGQSKAHQQSRHFKKQSSFAHSKRFVRGAVIRLLTTGEKTKVELLRDIGDNRTESVLTDLTSEGLIVKQKGTFKLSD